MFSKSLLLVFLSIFSCSSQQKFSSVKLGEYIYRGDKVEMVHHIGQDKLYKLRINEWGHSCHSEGSFNVDQRTLSLIPKNDFEEQVERDIYQIGECKLKDRKVRIVGEDSLKLDDYIFIYQE
jgi:hypothetical protein